MRVYIDLDENIDNISELHAYIITRDDKYIRVGGDIKLWATEKTGRWIPVSERLPEEDCETYLVCCANGYIASIMYDRYLGWLLDDDIVAWMPLPQPYKAESEE